MDILVVAGSLIAMTGFARSCAPKADKLKTSRRRSVVIFIS